MATFGNFGHRSITDGNLIATLAVPAAGATGYSSAIRLFPGRKPIGKHEIGVDVPALAALAATKTLTVTIQHSDASGSGYTDVETLAPIVLTGDADYGAADALQTIFPLPVDIKEYVRLKAVKESAGGDDTGVTLTLAILS